MALGAGGVSEVLWTMPDSAQDLFGALCSGVAPGGIQRPHMVPGIEEVLAA